MNTFAKGVIAIAGAAALTACGSGNPQTGPDPISVNPSAETSVSAADTRVSTRDHDGSNGNTAFSEADQQYVNFEAQLHQSEIEMSMIAERNGDHPQVKWLAQQIAQDHRAALQGLRDVAPGHVSIDAIAAQQNANAALQQFSGSALDRVYIEMMISTHTQAIAALQQFQSSNTSASDLRGHVQNLLPAMMRHLNMARDLAGLVGANPQGSASGSGSHTGSGTGTETTSGS